MAYISTAFAEAAKPVLMLGESMREVDQSDSASATTGTTAAVFLDPHDAATFGWRRRRAREELFGWTQLSAKERDARLLDAAVNSRTVQMRRAVLHSADLETEQERTGFVSLHWAALNGDIKGIEALFVAGATEPDLDAQSKTGRTALHLAVLCCHADVVDLLMTRGADPTVADITGATPLSLCTHWAVEDVFARHRSRINVHRARRAVAERQGKVLRGSAALLAGIQATLLGTAVPQIARYCAEMTDPTAYALASERGELSVNEQWCDDLHMMLDESLDGMDEVLDDAPDGETPRVAAVRAELEENIRRMRSRLQAAELTFLERSLRISEQLQGTEAAMTLGAFVAARKSEMRRYEREQ